MPVEKYHDVDEMRRALWRRPVIDPARRLARLLDFWRRAIPRNPPRGVHRFHSIEEANLARDAWSAAEIERLKNVRR